MPVVLDPGIKARLSDRLHLAPRGLQHLVQSFVQQLDVGGVIDQSGAAQQQVVVVTGKAFKEPQQFGVVLLGVVVLRHFKGTQLFDVPCVKVFVADQAQQGGVALAGFGFTQAGQVAAPANQGRGVAMLQPAIAFAHGIEHEDIAAVRCLAAVCAVPELDFGFANFLGIGQQTRFVE